MAMFPVRRLTGGEGWGGEKLEGTEPYLLVSLVRREMVGKGLADVEQISGEEELGSCDVLASWRRRVRVVEHQ